MAALWPAEHLAFVRQAMRAALAFDAPELRTRVMGLEFANPIGLAAGFDKDGRRARALAALGFGHLELGTVTAHAQHANPTPNLFRLPRDGALINRLGFPNEGAAALVSRLQRWRRGAGVPIGVSIGKSRSTPIEPIEGAIADYRTSFRLARQVADFVVVNVSSPNTKDLRAMQGAELARALLGALAEENGKERSASEPGAAPSLRGASGLPLLVKVAPDLEDAELEALLEVVEACGIDGVVATNTTIRRDGLATDARAVERIGAGGERRPLRVRSRRWCAASARASARASPSSASAAWPPPRRARDDEGRRRSRAALHGLRLRRTGRRRVDRARARRGRAPRGRPLVAEWVSGSRSGRP